ncbi:MAG: polysaccharide deacetylase family protein [Filifactoraceae bacterium]
MKNFIRLILFIMIIMCWGGIEISAQTSLSVSVDGKAVNYENSEVPYISSSGNPVVPLVSTMKALGADISYSEETKAITVKKDSNSIIIPLGKQYIKVEDKYLILSEPTVSVNGRTMVDIIPIVYSLRKAITFNIIEKNVSIENIPTFELLNFVDKVPEWAENPTFDDQKDKGTVVEESVDKNVVKKKEKTDLSGKKLVALTYDDGPNGKSTSIILDVLKENKVKATFFVLGTNVYNNKEQAIRTVSEGHEVANHSYSHKDLTKLGVSGINKEIQETQKAIKDVTGVTPTLLRVPYGAFNQNVKSNAGLPIIQWNIDTLDWKTRSADKTVNSVLNNVKDGDIVLMHNIHMSTAEATKILVPELIKRGYTLVTVSELAEAKGVQLKNGTVYNSFK